MSTIQDNNLLRDRFVAETAHLTGIQVSELSGFGGWKKNNAIFSVAHRGIEYYPSFQFLDGKPHPTIKKFSKFYPIRCRLGRKPSGLCPATVGSMIGCRLKC
jgi:hypothetical protein